jgi:hypothetical protein
LDCTTNKEPSEGLLLKRFLDICRLYKPAQATPLRYKIKSKSDFLNKLSTPKKYSIVHISAHGSPDGVSNAKNPTWTASIDEIAEAHKAKTTLVHLSACSTCNKKMSEAFNSKYFLAPLKPVEWIDAAAFSVLFYKRYIVDGVKLHNSLKYAAKATQTTSVYNFWQEV